MGLDLITQRNCDVKEEIPQNELLIQIKENNRANTILNMVMNQGKSEAEAREMNFTQRFQTQEGIKDVAVKVGDLLDKTSHLEKLGEKCNDCIISKNKSFGCIDYISYPISHKCEQWLPSIADSSNKKCMPFSTTIVFIQDQKIDGSRIAQMRSHGQTFFEYDKPTEILISKKLLKKETINTDQLLDVTFLQGIMQTTHINYLLMLYGGIVTADNKLEDRPFKYDKANDKYVYLDLNLPRDHDNSMAEFYKFFQHLFIALVNDHDVLMD